VRRWLAAASVLATLTGAVATGAQTAPPEGKALVLTRSDGAAVPALDFGGNKTCPPLLILSHGFGGSEEALAWLARAAAEIGFRAIAIGHRETGRAELRAVLRSPDRRAALTAAVVDRDANAARMSDLDAAWAYATLACRPTFAALAGHSMGAQLALVEAGAETTLGVAGKDRFDAYIALSPQGEGERFPPGAWDGIDKPVLMVTGTRDAGLEGDWQNRLTAFAGLPAGHKVLAVLEGGTHMGIGGRGRPRQQRDVTAIVLAFLRDMGKPAPETLPRRTGVRYQTK